MGDSVLESWYRYRRGAATGTQRRCKDCIEGVTAKSAQAAGRRDTAKSVTQIRIPVPKPKRQATDNRFAAFAAGEEEKEESAEQPAESTAEEAAAAQQAANEASNSGAQE